ncbi:MAG: polymer-forming cytoskeletal protein [Gammaproteobacteria bacterium]|nr:polymer-forming cytoskeletal protein [Gammaproteobacteria bacterium]MBU1490841.1 polymer-forming cytoskeletal protein [Gammaproteobacteria bacterium]MBU2066911.1 polymer-forming cytoskeletal protein [Gammaproteobacteria bacterium]MBU2137309.1 polymer-forming cytoskeletal protein [Gammaproteobacteria bacterium]MBU2217488.1 polymer-forming cytoskeletal protein [Gammaproteobacteria bacterium]
MWSKDKSKTDLQRFTGKTSLIAAGAELSGSLCFQGAVQIDGRVSGNLLATDGMVRVSVEGRVEGELRAPHIVIDGEVVGDVHAGEHLELGSRARVRGNLYYGLMEMAMGAKIEGRLCPLGEASTPLQLPETLDMQNS